MLAMLGILPEIIAQVAVAEVPEQVEEIDGSMKK